MATITYLTTGLGGIYLGKPYKGTSSVVLTRETTPFLNGNVLAYPYYFGQIAASNVMTSGVFKAVCPGYKDGEDGGIIMLSTRNGDSPSTWTEVHTSSSIGFLGAAYGNGKWVVCGQDNTIVTSSDGATWTESKGAMPGAVWNWMSYGGGTFVAVGGVRIENQWVGAIMSSTDGETWTKGNAGTSNFLNSIDYSPTLRTFVAVGNGGAIVSSTL